MANSTKIPDQLRALQRQEWHKQKGQTNTCETTQQHDQPGKPTRAERRKTYYDVFNAKKAVFTDVLTAHDLCTDILSDDTVAQNWSDYVGPIRTIRNFLGKAVLTINPNVRLRDLQTKPAPRPTPTKQKAEPAPARQPVQPIQQPAPEPGDDEPFNVLDLMPALPANDPAPHRPAKSLFTTLTGSADFHVISVGGVPLRDLSPEKQAEALAEIAEQERERQREREEGR